MALLNRSDELAEALAVLDDVLTRCEIRQRNLVAVRDILLRHERPERCAVLIGDALSALHFLDTRHDIVAFIHQQCIDHNCPPISCRFLQYIFFMSLAYRISSIYSNL